MRWELSFCNAEIEGNEIRVELKKPLKAIEYSFKIGGPNFIYRSMMPNFGYNTFRKLLRNKDVLLDSKRIEQFRAVFNAIQEKEKRSAVSLDARTITSGAKYCASCGDKLPNNLEIMRFCPGCGAPISS
jgi:hypothetical protein